MPIFMETTEVSDTRTAGQIQELLAAKGAKSIMVGSKTFRRSHHELDNQRRYRA